MYGEKGLPMSKPIVQPLLLPVLKAVADGSEHRVEEIRKRVAEELGLTDDYVKPINPKTRQRIYVNHIAFALLHLHVGKAITKKQDGVYQIAERGRAILASGVSDLTIREARHA
jgi:restriction system protein